MAIIQNWDSHSFYFFNFFDMFIENPLKEGIGEQHATFSRYSGIMVHRYRLGSA